MNTLDIMMLTNEAPGKGPSTFTGLDWTGGLTLKSIFMASNKTHWPVGLYDALC